MVCEFFVIFLLNLIIYFMERPTVLCKIVGVYQIGYHNRVTGKRTMEQVAVMQVCSKLIYVLTMNNTSPLTFFTEYLL